MAVTRYAIADYLSEEQKRRAVDATYLPGGWWGRCRRTVNGCCPLGVAIDETEGAPPADVIAALLGLEERRAVQAAAGRFILDWDCGHLPTDRLATALGLEP